MTRPRLSFALGLLTLVSLPALAAEEHEEIQTAEEVPTTHCLTPLPGSYGGVAQPPLHYPGGECIDPNCTQCGQQQTWWTRMRGDWSAKSRSFRRWWYRHGQSKKGLQHPAIAPVHQPGWGYHQTCWRRFPATCRQCPPLGASQYQTIPPDGHQTPTPAVPPAVGQDAKPSSKAETVLPVFSLDKDAKKWLRTGER